MLFKKKSTKPTSTFQDKKLYELQEDRLTAYRRLQERAEKVIICNGAIDLYPEGADKEKAKRDAEKAKYSLLCAIGVYDDLVNQYQRAFDEPYERVTTTYYGRECATSHEIIEKTYKNFYKRG